MRYQSFGAVGNLLRNQSPSMQTPSADKAEDIRRLNDRVDRLTLVCMAMWSLLRDRAKMTEDDLLLRVQEIDLADGQEDGKVTRSVVRCVKCNRVMSPRHDYCLYCGEVRLSQTAFDPLT